MLKFAHLILKNLGRNKLRTSLTAIAVMVLVAIYSIVSIVTDRVNQMVAAYSSQTRLIVRERWTAPSRFPARYVPKIAATDGVEDWTVWNFYAGHLGSEELRMGGLATRIENIKEMHHGLEELDQRFIDAMAQDKTGALVGSVLMERWGWEVGDRFTLTGLTHLGKNLEFKIIGVLPSEMWAQTFFFRRDYYQQGVGDEETVNVMWLRVRDAETGKRLARELEKMFENSPAELRVETESAGVTRISGRLETVVNIINFVGTVLLIDMVIILANSISMTVRERNKEMAILKVLGFQPNFIAGLVIFEAVFVGAVSGTLGAALAFLFCSLNSAGSLPFQISYLMQFPVTANYITQGFVVGALVGFAGSAIPAWTARNIKVADIFSAEG